MHHHRQEHEETQELLFHVLEMQKEESPKGSVDMAMTVHLLAEHYRVLGHAKDAQQMYEAALTMQSTLVGKRDPGYLKMAHDFARHLAQAGHLEEAAERLRDVVKQREDILGPAHPDVAVSLRLLSDVYTHQKCFDEAQAVSDRANVLLHAFVV